MRFAIVVVKWCINYVKFPFCYQFQNIKQVLNAIQKYNEARISHELKSQRFIISSILSHASQKIRSLWSAVQQHMPKNMFNFTIKFLNNTLATRKSLSKWAISQSSACSFYLKAETLQHVFSSCSVNLEEGRCSWRDNSVLLFLTKPFHIHPIAQYMPIFLHCYHHAS